MEPLIRFGSHAAVAGGEGETQTPTPLAGTTPRNRVSNLPNHVTQTPLP